jgi:undecaprenyl-diphosphatase
LLSLVTVFRLFYIQWGPLDLSPDEAHYWEWSRHLDISYYSKGPMVAFLIFLTTSLGEHSVFFVRLGAVVISALASIVLFLLAKDMFKSERIGFFAALLPHLTLLFSAGSILMTIDPPFLLFWGLTLSCFYRALKFNRLYWYPAGIAFGLGFLSKFSMALFLPLAFFILRWHPKYRFWLKRKEPYVALALGGILCYPVFLWNSRHQWVTFRHLFGQAHSGHSFNLSLSGFFEFLGSQIGLISPLLFAGLAYALYQSARLGFSQNREEHLFLFSTSLPILVFFLLISFQTKVQANWAAPAYFSGLISTAAIFDARYQAAKSKRKEGPWKALIALALLLAAIPTALAHDTRFLYRCGLPPRWDPAVRIQGWAELGERVSGNLEEMSRANRTFLFSDRYQVASELAFYVRGQPTTYCVNLGRRMNQYDLWEGFLGLRGQDALYVKQGNRKVEPEVRNAFASVTKEPILAIYRGGERVRRYTIFRCYGYRGVKIERPKGTY